MVVDVVVVVGCVVVVVVLAHAFPVAVTINPLPGTSGVGHTD